MRVEGRAQQRAARVVIVFVLAVEALLVDEQAVDGVDDEVDVLRFALRAGQIEPHLRAGPLEVAEVDGVVDVAEAVDVTEDDLPGNHEPAILPARNVRHASLYRRSRRGHWCGGARAGL